MIIIFFVNARSHEWPQKYIECIPFVIDQLKRWAEISYSKYEFG